MWHFFLNSFFFFFKLKFFYSRLTEQKASLFFQILCEMVLVIGNKLPSNLTKHNADWGISVCKSTNITNSKVAKNVVAAAISLSSPPTDLIVAKDMAAELLKVTGSETEESIKRSAKYPLINESTSSAIGSCILQFLEAVIADMEWGTRKLKIISSISQNSTHLSQNGELASRLTFEENLYCRAEAVVEVLSHFASMSLKGICAFLCDNFLYFIYAGVSPTLTNC